MNTTAELPRDLDDINDAELVNIQAVYLGSATQHQPLPGSESDVTGKLAHTLKCGDERLAAVCAVEPGRVGSTRKRRRPGLGRNPMERFWRTHLAVTQVCSQTWCELQVTYGFEIPHVLNELEKRPEVMAGASIHLSREMEVQKVVAVPVLSREDRQAIPFLNLLSMIPALQAGLLVRELPVFGVLEGVFLVGVVDELCYSEKGELVLTELKTRRVNALPGLAQVKGYNLQVQLYKLLFDSLVRGNLKRDHVISHLRLRPEQVLGRGVLEHAGKMNLQVSTFGDLLDLLLLNLSYCELPTVARLTLEYCHQGSGAPIGTQDVPFAEPQVREELRYYLSYWTGHREPRGVDIEEAWKCNTCPYKAHCEWNLEVGSADMVTTPTKRTITEHTIPQYTGHSLQDPLTTPTKRTVNDHALPQDTGHAKQPTVTTPTNQTQDSHSVTKTDD